MLPARPPGPIQIRPLTRDDRDAWPTHTRGFGKETRRRRLRSAAPHLTEHDLDALTPASTIATTRRRPPSRRTATSSASHATSAPAPARGVAEVAIAVDDPWQGRGIGRRLLEELATRARAAGVTHFIAYVGADNAVVRRWIARLGGVTVAQYDDEVAYGVPLHRPAERRRRRDAPTRPRGPQARLRYSSTARTRR